MQLLYTDWGSSVGGENLFGASDLAAQLSHRLGDCPAGDEDVEQQVGWVSTGNMGACERFSRVVMSRKSSLAEDMVAGQESNILL